MPFCLNFFLGGQGALRFCRRDLRWHERERERESSALLLFVFGRVPLLNRLHKKGTLILSSLLEDLDKENHLELRLAWQVGYNL